MQQIPDVGKYRVCSKYLIYIYYIYVVRQSMCESMSSTSVIIHVYIIYIIYVYIYVVRQSMCESSSVNEESSILSVY